LGLNSSKVGVPIVGMEAGYVLMEPYKIIDVNQIPILCPNLDNEQQPKPVIEKTLDMSNSLEVQRKRVFNTV
jgi:hypothetical protein